MPYLQKATNNYVGFVPARIPQGGLQINEYVATTSGTTIFAGDPLILTSMGTVRSWTSAAAGLPPIFATSAAQPVGVAAQYIPAYAATSNPPTCLVYDDPGQVFYINNSTSIAVATSDLMGAGAIFLATGVIGSTGGNTQTGRSNVAFGAPLGTGWLHSTNLGLQSSGVNGLLTSGVYPLQVLGIHPIEGAQVGTNFTGGLSSALGQSYKWLVRFNLHIYGQGGPLFGNVLTSA